jgi:hypothetical protein
MAFEPHIDATAANIIGSAGGDIADHFMKAFAMARKYKDEEDLQGGHVGAAVKDGLMDPSAMEDFTSGNRSKKLQLGSEAQLLLKQYQDQLKPPPIQLTPEELKTYTDAGMVPLRIGPNQFQAVAKTPAAEGTGQTLDVNGQKVLVLPKNLHGLIVGNPEDKKKPMFTPSAEDTEWAKQNGMRFLPQSTTGAGTWMRGAEGDMQVQDIPLPDGRVVRGVVTKGGFKSLPGQTAAPKLSADDRLADKAAATIYEKRGEPTVAAKQARLDQLAEQIKDPGFVDKYRGDIPEDQNAWGTIRRLHREINAAAPSAGARTAPTTTRKVPPMSSANKAALEVPPLPAADDPLNGGTGDVLPPLPGGPAAAAVAPAKGAKGKPDEATVREFIKKAGGDLNKAREMARAAGYAI